MARDFIITDISASNVQNNKTSIDQLPLIFSINGTIGIRNVATPYICNLDGDKKKE
jgi:hypothetical protein